MKIQISQINTTPRDFKGNTAKIVAGIDLADKQKCDLLVFPELTIPGYLSQDLVYTSSYVQTNLRHLHDVVQHTRDKKPFVVLGYLDHNRKGTGKPFTNMAAVIRNGTIIATYQKQLLPFYDVFDEGRYFEPGSSPTIVDICNKKWGILICEDAWNDKGSDDYNYANNPLEVYRKLGIKHFISINSSPFVQGKPLQRANMLAKSVDKGGVFIYVNQVGGQDELVFDGHSFIIQNLSSIHCPIVLPMNETHVSTTISDDSVLKVVLNDEAPNWQRSRYLAFDDHLGGLYEALVISLRDYVRKSGFEQVVLGSSGGIDSAVVACIACEALGPKNVHCIRMPSIYSSDHSRIDAKHLHKNLGCFDYEYPINHLEVVDNIKGCLSCGFKYNPIADENIQARMRGMILMHFSNAYGALLLTTGNKTELALGYYTLYGDSNGSFAVIKDLYKGQVYAIAKHINMIKDGIIPNGILSKAPSAELAPGQEDEKSLLPYVVLDPIVRCYVEEYIDNFSQFKIFANIKDRIFCEWLNGASAEKEYNAMIGRIDQNEFKRRQSAIGPKVSAISFGSGRRIPIVKGLR
jgi:NAD+ synthase (glutamine-hydrolysing)